MRIRLAFLVPIVLFTSPMVAQAQVAPRMMIAIDTSGSMALDLNGTPTYGDGVLTGCTRLAAGQYCGTDCRAGIDTDCNGEPDDSRMYVAAEAVRSMILSSGGDVEWAMSRFDQDSSVDAICNVELIGGDLYGIGGIQDVECTGTISSYGNPQCNTYSAVTTCGGGLVDTGDFPTSCRPGRSGRPSLQYLDYYDVVYDFDGNPLTNPQVCMNYVPGACDATAASGQVIVGFPDIAPYVGRTNVFGLLKWIDHRESAFDTYSTEGDVCHHSAGGDCELLPIGRTPLAGILAASGNYLTTVRATDGARSCRPYSIILLTDGAETCGGDPVARARTLSMTNDIRTYVVGMSITTLERPMLESIATAGGTTAFFADDQVALSAALSSIVADSLLVETCNGADDDCDTRIDEGVTNACGGCGAVPVETCNGLDDDCDGTIDDGVANACGTCGPPPVEICNRVDDDCDGVIDEGGVCGTCTPSAEICDGLDNDCDGTTDEGLTRSCGTDVGECTAGVETCSAGSWGSCVGSVGPTTEACNGRDDDCDGAIDGISRSCGSDVGACAAGTQVCTSGSWGTCTGAVGMSPEVCDGLDNDCDGSIDEGNPGGGDPCGSSIGICEPGTLQCSGGMLTCVGGIGPDPSETCNGLDDDCDGMTDDGVPTMGPCGSSTGECSEGVMTCVSGSFTCVGARGPTTEVCDGRDNDCDGSSDEGNPGGGASCGSDTGACSTGTAVCSGGMLTCTGGVGPSAEACNTTDDDCDGLIDEGNPGGGASCGMTDVGACDFGAEACVSGMLVCVGTTGPSAEICDGVDNDCDGMTDEGDPEGGGACGDDTGECTSGTLHCVGGTLTCDGGTGPSPEVCDGLDNDCNGIADDGIPVGAPCGTDVGECAPGVNICSGGSLVCDGAIGPSAEVCDNLDNDCNGMIDDGLGVGDECGTDEGLCMPGTSRCIGGRIVCEGEVGPARETCDCEDNNCDGNVDEPPPSGSLCPAGSTCVECQCALPCQSSEFGFTCPTGRTPEVNGAGECYCVAPRCDADACAMQTVEQDGNTRCAPDSADVSNCVCKNNECTFPCEGVVCSEGTVCDPRDPAGRCVEDSCRGLGCPSGQICDVVSGECTDDACADVTCDEEQACRDGVCEASCGSTTCAGGEVCHAGTCTADPCAGASCSAEQVCDPSDGSCVDDLCESVHCIGGQVCDLATGACVADPCNTLHCPAGQVCEGGECARDTSMIDAGVDAGVDAGPHTTDDDHDRVLAAGGCSCRVGAQPRGGSSSALFLLFGVAMIVVVRRRRSAKGLVAAAAISSALLASGCSVDPFCLDCGDGGTDAGPIRDAGRDAGRRDAGPRDAGTDAGRDAAPDGCVPGAPEVCNGVDDNCDGVADEGIDTDTDVDNCGGCGEACAPLGAFPSCVGGVCGIASCDVGHYDLDGDPDNGCEYRCLPDADDDSICDLRDNDCDGTTDEDVDLNGDPNNCGSCAHVCRFAHGSGACDTGACTLGTCDADWYDIDGTASNGCEYACTPASPATEVCNGRDDDCDGMTDEEDPGGGSACGTDEGVCTTGVEHCMSGTIVCTGSTGPTAETCDGLDNNCNGSVDEGNPEGGRVCGTSTGTCESGREVCTGGALVCTGAIGPSAEVCDGLDNDCDGNIDEGNPGGGGTCGDDTGSCSFGTMSCRGGVLVCEGAVGPRTETCNGADDDCDGMVDDGDPGGGGTCGTDVGVCSPGTLHCSGGTLTCMGGTGPRAGGELCNSLDDNCDGRIDEGDPGGGASCGMTAGACSSGTMTCVGGALTCTGGVGPTIETCNGVDDDCNGVIDDGFDTSSDIRNCGMCGHVCSVPNATPACVSRMCTVASCNTGWRDLDPDEPGCEYRCDFAGSEICNGRDDDCDGSTDEGLSAPSTFCNPNGVCGGTTPTCGGASGWQCNYPSTFEATEVSCDRLDNDCDGAVDEPFPGVDTSCSSGAGTCRRTGVIACTADHTSTFCTAPPAGTPAAYESCNNVDDDCDGRVDEAIPASAIPTVTVPRPSGGTVRVMAYEASRPDATATNAGSVTTRACSNANVLPWTNLTWTQANNACCALNAGGTCLSGGAGWRLCDAPDWEASCTGPSSSCDWSYASSCSSSSRMTCNGEEFDSGSGSGDQDAVYPTASSTFPMCYTDWGSAGVVYDLSGNVKEWTATATATGIHEIRGGSYNNVENGRTCQFDFTVGGSNFAFPNTGFRCCFY